MVGLEVVASALDPHVGLEIGDDAAPDVGGSERIPGHASFWWERSRSRCMRVRQNVRNVSLSQANKQN